jgi:23S rRNA A1618 N6-methylase RlmF
MERSHSLFWTPCVAYCIDLMLKNMGKTSFIKEVIDHARSVPKFIYNHIWVFSLMRRHTKNRELSRPAITRFSTNFITLQSLLQCKFELKQMFVCNEWQDFTYSRKENGKAIVRLVYNDSFWEGVTEVC